MLVLYIHWKDKAMTTIGLITAAAALALAAGAAPAQPGAAAGTSAPGASAPSASQAGRGPGNGPGMMGRGHGARWGDGFTPGWSMMSGQEREEHQAKMRSMTDYDDCRSYLDQHHQQMSERARQRGTATPARPRRDACAALKP
jgi:hypothetical protein